MHPLQFIIKPTVKHLLMLNNSLVPQMCPTSADKRQMGRRTNYICKNKDIQMEINKLGVY